METDKSLTFQQADNIPTNLTWATADGDGTGATRRGFFTTLARAGVSLLAGLCLEGVAQHAGAAVPAAVPAASGAPTVGTEVAAGGCGLDPVGIHPGGPLGRVCTYIYGPFSRTERTEVGPAVAPGLPTTYVYGLAHRWECVIDTSGQGQR